MSLLVRPFIRCKKLIFVGRDGTLNHIPLVQFSAKSFVPTIYDKSQDPGPKFFAPDVQSLLKRLTRPDFAKVFRKRTSRTTALTEKMQRLPTPQYKFLTTEQLEEEIAQAQKKADKLLQMPPVVKIKEHVDKVLSRDPALIGFDSSKYVFTDISFGACNETRIIVERDAQGTLQQVTPDTRKRLNQIYFPMEGRKMRAPPMFTDLDKLYSLLERREYEFVLNRACVQYDPDEPAYQELTSIVYQHVDSNKDYNLLRSTRHFGPLVFYLAWHRSADGLLLELLQTGRAREAVCLVALRHALHADVAGGEQAGALAARILSLPIEPPTYETLTEDDIQVDSECMDCIARYVANNSAMKGLQELALQAFKENYQQQVQLSRGLKKAHGNV